MTGNIKVASKRNLSPEIGFTDIYVGRPNPLGNPYPMKNEDEREIVIFLYRKWLWNQIKWSQSQSQSETAAYQELRKICSLLQGGVNVRLVCWCAPAPCHADIIVRAINWLLTQ